MYVYPEGALPSVAGQWFVIGFVCCLLPALAVAIPAVLYLRRRLRWLGEDSEVADDKVNLDPSPNSGKAGSLNPGFSGSFAGTKEADNVYTGLDNLEAHGDNGSIYENNESIYDKPDTGSLGGAGGEAYVELQLMK